MKKYVKAYLLVPQSIQREREMSPKQDNKNAEILFWPNLPEKKLLQIYIIFIGRQRRYHHIQFIDEKSRSLLGPFARVPVGPSGSLSSIGDCLPSLTLLAVEGPLIHYWSFKTASHSTTYFSHLLSQEDRAKMCVLYVSVCM